MKIPSFYFPIQIPFISHFIKHFVFISHFRHAVNFFSNSTGVLFEDHWRCWRRVLYRNKRSRVNWTGCLWIFPISVKIWQFETRWCFLIKFIKIIHLFSLIASFWSWVRSLLVTLLLPSPEPQSKTSAVSAISCFPVKTVLFYLGFSLPGYLTLSSSVTSLRLASSRYLVVLHFSSS